MTALFMAALLCTGCKSTAAVNEPDEPDPEPALNAGPPPERSLENSAGIIISSSPSLEVKVDGKSVGKAPLTVEHLASGEHEVTFIDDAEGNATYTVELGEGEFKKLHHSRSPNASDARLGQ